MTETTRSKSPKKPADRKPAGNVLVGEYKGKKFKIDKTAFEDYEYLELSAEIDTNPAKLPPLLRLVFGDKGHELLKETARGENGRVRTEDLMAAYQAVMEDAGAKNS